MLLRMQKNPTNRGVSFIELLVAVILFAMTVTGLVNLFGSSKRWIEHSQARMTVGELAKRVLDPIQADVREDQWAAGNCLSTGVGCGPPTIQIQGRTYNIFYTVNSGPILNLTSVRVDINWTENAY